MVAVSQVPMAAGPMSVMAGTAGASGRATTARRSPAGEDALSADRRSGTITRTTSPGTIVAPPPVCHATTRQRKRENEREKPASFSSPTRDCLVTTSAISTHGARVPPDAWEPASTILDTSCQHECACSQRQTCTPRLISGDVEQAVFCTQNPLSHATHSKPRTVLSLFMDAGMRGVTERDLEGVARDEAGGRIAERRSYRLQRPVAGHQTCRPVAGLYSVKRPLAIFLPHRVEVGMLHTCVHQRLGAGSLPPPYNSFQKESHPESFTASYLSPTARKRHAFTPSARQVAPKLWCVRTCCTIQLTSNPCHHVCIPVFETIRAFTESGRTLTSMH